MISPRAGETSEVLARSSGGTGGTAALGASSGGGVATSVTVGGAAKALGWGAPGASRFVEELTVQP